MEAIVWRCFYKVDPVKTMMWVKLSQCQTLTSLAALKPISTKVVVHWLMSFSQVENLILVKGINQSKWVSAFVETQLIVWYIHFLLWSVNLSLFHGVKEPNGVILRHWSMKLFSYRGINECFTVEQRAELWLISLVSLGIKWSLSPAGQTRASCLRFAHVMLHDSACWNTHLLPFGADGADELNHDGKTVALVADLL